MEWHSLLTKKGIWCIGQNKPSLVADDLEAFGVPRVVTHAVLLARGVYKWFAVRRDLIRLKNRWKDNIKETLAALKHAKSVPNNAYNVGYQRGYLRAYEECRADVRALCHSDRWRAPDFDTEARAFLDSFEGLDCRLLQEGGDNEE